MSVAGMNFGIGELVPGAYQLQVRDARDATLYEIDADGVPQFVATAVGWSVLAETVEIDWNRRLAAKDEAIGAMPTPAGDVLLHRQFGRELDVLLSVAASYQEGVEMARLWADATPGWRLELWKKLREYRENPKNLAWSSQDLQEWLRQCAPDGSEDEERKERLFARRRAAKDRVRAEQKTLPAFKAPKVRWHR